jgi:DNA-binding winged helix-turn-helix (wHTH) protein
MPHSYRFANVEVLPVERQLLLAGRPVPVGSRAFDLLLALVEARSRLVTKAELFDRVWPGLVVGENNLQAQVSALRKILGAGAIKTVPGQGYRFATRLDQDEGGANGRVHAAAASEIRTTSAEQALLDPFAVFVGAFRVEVAEQVLPAPGRGDPPPATAVQRLVERGLLQSVPGTPGRLRLADPIRIAANDRLRAHGKLDAAHRRHGHAMAALARTARSQYFGMPESDWVRAYRLDYEDFDVAFERACERRDAATAGSVGLILFRMDIDRDTSRARRRKDAAFDLLKYADPETRAALLRCISSIQSVPIARMGILEASIEREAICRRLKDPLLHYSSLMRLARAYAHEGQVTAAQSALRSARAAEDPAWPARARFEGAFNASAVGQETGDADGMREGSLEMERIALKIGDSAALAMARHQIAFAAILSGDLSGGVDRLNANQAALREAGLWRILFNAHAARCGALLRMGDVERAREAARDALPVLRGSDAPRLLDHLAFWSARCGRHHDAAMLLGYGDSSREWKAGPGPRLDAQATWEAATAVQHALGTREHSRLRRIGSEMTHDQVFALAVDAIAAAS